MLSYPPEPVNWGPMTALPANASDDELADYAATSCAMIIEEAEKFMLRGSGHGIYRVLRFELKLDRWAPVRGASFLPTPHWIVSKKCCVNVRNDDQDCFRYAITAAVDRPDTHTERPAYYNAYERRALFASAASRYLRAVVLRPSADSSDRIRDTLSPSSSARRAARDSKTYSLCMWAMRVEP